MKNIKVVLWTIIAILSAALFIILMEEEMKKAKIIIWSIIAVAILALLVVLLIKPASNWWGFNIFGISSYRYADSDKYTIGNADITAEINSIDIGWVAGSVRFEEHDGNSIIVTESESDELSDDQKLHWWVKDDKLYIKYCASGYLRYMPQNKKNLTVRVPKDSKYAKVDFKTVSSSLDAKNVASDDIGVDNVSGSVSFENITCDSINIDSVSGKVMITNMTANDCDVDSVSGKIKIEKSVCSNASLKTVSGEIDTELDEARSVDCDTVSGDVYIYLAESTGFTAKFNTVSGNFSSDFACTLSQKKYIFGDGSLNIDINTVSGSAHVDKK